MDRVQVRLQVRLDHVGVTVAEMARTIRVGARDAVGDVVLLGVRRHPACLPPHTLFLAPPFPL